MPVDGDPQGMGLRIMGYRARMIGASLRVHPSEGGGTTVSCLFDANTGYYNEAAEITP